MTLLMVLLLQQGNGGVFVDADGVVRTRDVSADKKLRELRDAAKKSKEPGEMVYLSLPRLFAEARAAGEKLPDEIRYLKGMTRLRYVFVYPNEKDIVIAGPAEPIDATFPGRPVGKRTGRPVLQLDDLVVLLRAKEAFGCSIDFTDEGAERMKKENDKWKDTIAGSPKKRREAYDAIAKAAGTQPVRFFGVPADTRVAFVCLEADYLLKRHSIGLEPTPVKAAPSLTDLVKSRGSISDRSWFETCYEPIRVSADGLAFEIAGQALQIKGRRQMPDGADAEPAPVSKAYAEKLTAHMNDMAREWAAWADLQNLADLSVLAALIRADGLAEKAGWDAAAAIKDHAVAKVDVAKSVPTMINFREAGDFLVVISGGVTLEPDAVVRRRDTNPKDDPAKKAKRPDVEWAVVTPEP